LSQAILFIGSIHAMFSKWRDVVASEPPGQVSVRVPSIAGSQYSISASLQRNAQISAQFDRADSDFFRLCAIWKVYGVPYVIIVPLLSGIYWLVLSTTGQRKR
jgi:hypothetical protein